MKFCGEYGLAPVYYANGFTTGHCPCRCSHDPAMLRHQSLTQGLDWLRDPISSSSTALLELKIPGRLRGRGVSCDWTDWARVTKAVFYCCYAVGCAGGEMRGLLCFWFSGCATAAAVCFLALSRYAPGRLHMFCPRSILMTLRVSRLSRPALLTSSVPESLPSQSSEIACAGA